MKLGYTILSVADVTASLQFYERALSAKPWGQVVSYVRAPDGGLIELCTPVGQ